MEYTITFSDVMAAVITAGGGLMVFFIRRWFNSIEKNNADLQEQIRKGNQEIRQQIERNDEKVNERIDRLEEKTEADIHDIRQEINDIKGDFATTFVLREDFFRSMNGVEDRVKSMDQKLDRLLMMNTEKK